MDKYQYYIMLRDPHVDNQKIVEVSRAQVGRDGLTLNEVALLLLAVGRIDAAETVRRELLQHNDLPSSHIPAFLSSALGFGSSTSIVPFEHAVICAVASPHQGVMSSKLDVLRHIQDNPDWWPWRKNLVCGAKTSIMHLLESNINSSSNPDYWVFGQQDKEDVLKQLLNMGEDINVVTTHFSPLSCLLRSCDLSTISDDDDDNVKSHPQRLKRWLAHYQHMLDAGRALGADLNINSHLAYETALTSIYDYKVPPKIKGLPVLVQFLLDNNIPLQSPRVVPQTVALWPQVCLSDLPLMVQLLVDHHVDANWSDPDTGNNLWHVVGNSPDPYTRRALLSVPPARLSLSAQSSNHKGVPSFHAAVNSLSIPLMQHALDAGAPINAATPKSKVAFESIRKTGKKAQMALDDIAKWLQSKGGVLSASKSDAQMLEQACSALALDQIINLLASGASPHGSSPSSRSPAFRVLDAVRTVDVSFRAQSMTKQLECLKKLHLAGIDINARDKQGNTLLHRSVAHGLPAMTKWLLDNGVDPMIKNGSNLYPAHMLLYGASSYVHPLQTKAALALMFVEHGVDIDVCSPQGDRGFEDVREEPDIVAALQKRALEKQLEHVLPQGSGRRKM